MSATYPADRQRCGFAVRYLRWLYESGAVNEIGPDAASILAAVVLQEDAIHYQRAPSFWNPQLMLRAGFTSEPTFIAARSRAIKAGLLNYTRGAKARPAVYFVQGFTNESLENVPEYSKDSEVYRGRITGENQNILTPTLTPTNKKARAASQNGKPKPPTGFDQWYQAYPRHVARGAAERAYPAALKRIATDQADPVAWLLERTIAYAKSINGTDPKFMPHPATWLNQDRFFDEESSRNGHHDQESIYPDRTAEIAAKRKEREVP